MIFNFETAEILEMFDPQLYPNFLEPVLIHRSAQSLIYRGIDKTSGESRILKVLNSKHPDSHRIAVFRYEFETLQQFNHPGIIKAFELQRYGSTFSMILEDFNGISLASHIKKRESAELERSSAHLLLAINLAKALGTIHKNKMIHRAVHPENIIFNIETLETKLIDFALSTSKLDGPLLQAENQIPQESLPYLSPEQTGRVNIPVDHRTDFYSLGMVLYELFTGDLPFQGDDAASWFYNHIAKQPDPSKLKADGIPENLALVIMKLINKNPQDRYQSAHGLCHDLRTCQSILLSKNQSKLMVPGLKDISEIFQIPGTIIGRDKERSQLLEFIKRTSAGEFCQALVSGFSGTGKSTLVKNLHDIIYRHQGIFIEGKFKPSGVNIPYSGLKEAFSQLAKHILTMPDDVFSETRTKLKKIIGSNGKLLIDFAPEMEWIIGEQPPLPELNPRETGNRFLAMIHDVMRLMAKKNHLLVLFLDDLQWIDQQSVVLLKAISSSQSLSHLMLICTYRDNEVGVSHMLHDWISAFKEKTNRLSLTLAPLNQNEVNTLAAMTLHLPENQCRDLSGILYHRSKGNPWFVHELLKAYHDRKWIWFDHENGCWDQDMEQISQAGLSDNIADFVLKQLETLPSQTRKALEISACMGHIFHLKLLAQSLGLTLTEAADRLFPALDKGMIAPFGGDHHLVKFLKSNEDEDVSYQFLHDRIHQAVYNKISIEYRPQLHLDIGKMMLETLPAKEIEENLMEITGHLNRGRALIKNTNLCQRLIKLNYQAGKKAKVTAAFHSSFNYFSIAKSFLDKGSCKTDDFLTFDLLKHYAESAYLSGEKQIAEKTFNTLIENAKRTSDTIDLLLLQSIQYATGEALDRSIETGIKALNMIGIHISKRSGLPSVVKELLTARFNLKKRFPADLLERPEITDARTITALKLLKSLVSSANLSGQKNLAMTASLKMVNLCLKFGNTAEAAIGFVFYAAVLTGTGQPGLGNEFGKLAVALARKMNDKAVSGFVHYVYALFVLSWNAHHRDLIPYFKRAVIEMSQSGDFLGLGHAYHNQLVWNPDLNAQSAITLAEKILPVLEDMNYADALDSTSLYRQLLNNLTGKTLDQNSLSDDFFSEEDCVTGMKKRQYRIGLGIFYLYKAKVLFWYGTYTEALDQIKQLRSYQSALEGLPWFWETHLYSFLIHSALYPGMIATEKLKTRLTLKRNYRFIKRWARHCPVNFLHHQQFMEAELERLKNHPATAEKLYKIALETVKNNDHLFFEAMMNEIASNFFHDQGLSKDAEQFGQEAIHLYFQWGATAKVKQLTQTIENRAPVQNNQ